MDRWVIETIVAIVALLAFLVVAIYFLARRVSRLQARAAAKAAELTAAIANAESEEAAQTVRENAANEDAYAQMKKSLRNWGISLLIFGGLQFVAGQYLSISWGVVLIIVGLVSFAIPEVEMFIIYAGVLAFAAINNLLAEQGWIVLGIMQAIWTISVFRVYVKNRTVVEKKWQDDRAEGEPWSEPTPLQTRASQVFPWAALGVAAVGWLTFLPIVLIPFPNMTLLTGIILEILISLGLMGIPLGIASLVARHPAKGAAILGLGGSSLLFLTQMALIYLL